MRASARFLRDHWIYGLIILGLAALFYLHSVYADYSRQVDELLEADAFAHTIDIYGTSKSGTAFITNLSYENREKRRLLRYEEIPDALVQAVLSVEDKRFFHHYGLDFRRIGKAAYVNLRAGRRQEGASTISMQLARSLWLHRDKTWKRKLAETFIAIHLERKLSKAEIFELYANQVDLGQHGTFNIHGFGEAARLFFGKEIGELTLAEAATLAGMIQRPSYYSPERFPERAQVRRNFVLKLMGQNGYSNSAELKAAMMSPLQIAVPDGDGSQAPYFVDLMKRELQSRLSDGLTQRYRVNTTIDTDLQRDALDAVHVGMQEVERQLAGRSGSKADLAGLQVALIALDPHTGEIKALVGGRNYRESQLNHATARRQPGSIFKPFVYAAALATTLKIGDADFTSATILEDEPASFWFNGQRYAPDNFAREYYGAVTLKTALVRSVNVATVHLAQRIGYPAVVQLARAAGLSVQPTPSVALGAYEASPLEMAGAYTVFANAGTFVEPHFISTVQDQAGSVIYRSTPKRVPVLDSRVAYLMVDLLQEVLRSGTGAAVRASGFVVPAAGKTGTSRDGWFAGFTSDLLCIVWVGFDDHRDLGLQGARSALPIWTEFMKRAVQHGVSAKPFRAPPGIVAVEVDPQSGQLATPYCESSQVQFFVAGTEPATTCAIHTAGPNTISSSPIDTNLDSGIQTDSFPDSNLYLPSTDQ